MAGNKIQVASLHKAAEDFEKITDILLEKSQASCKEETDWEESTHSKKVISAGAKLIIIWFRVWKEVQNKITLSFYLFL